MLKKNDKQPHRHTFPEAEVRDGPSKSGRIHGACGRRISEHKQKIFGQWVCELAQLDNGVWVHRSRIYEKELEGHTVVQKMYEDV